MNFQRAFVFLNHQKYTAGLHAAQFLSQTLRNKELAYCMRNGIAVCFGLTLVPGVGIFSMPRQGEMHALYHQAAFCPAMGGDPLQHTQMSCQLECLFFRCLANACSATIISAQVG